jgi:hypothetical protein
MSRPALRVVNDLGEVLDEHPEVIRLQDEIAGLQRALASESRKLEQLKRDKAAEAAEHQMWPKALDVFRAWQQATNHPRASWPGTAGDRFWAVEPFLRKYGLEQCLRAVAGMAFDHFSVTRKNGTIRRFDEWGRIFSTTDEFEERANRAPKGWRENPIYGDVIKRWSETRVCADSHQNIKIA